MKKLFGILAIISFVLTTAAAEGNAGIATLSITVACTALFAWLAGAFDKEIDNGGY